MCTICRRFWHSRQYPSTTDQKPTSSFPVPAVEASLKLSMAKCHFRVQEVDFLGPTLKTKGVAPQMQKIAKFLEKVKFPGSKKALQGYIGFLNYYRNNIPRLTERLNPFLQLLKTTNLKAKIPITPDSKKEFRELNEALNRCCQLALRQPLHVNNWFS